MKGLVMKDALTTGEAAKYCGVNFRTVIRWIEKGYLQAYKLPGRGDNRIPIADFKAFLIKNNMPIPEELASEGRQEGISEVTLEKLTFADQEQTLNKVLVVEDEVLMAKSMSRTIKRSGFDVLTASNGIQAGIMLERYRPDIVTLDLQMPEMSGYDVLRALRENAEYENIKVLIVSAATKEKMQKAMALGGNDVLEKPFRAEELKSKLDLLAGH
jgi:excisionase family DNA binding protein